MTRENLEKDDTKNYKIVQSLHISLNRIVLIYQSMFIVQHLVLNFTIETIYT